MELRTELDHPLLTEPCDVSIVGVAAGELVDVEVVCDYGPASGGSPRVWAAQASFIAGPGGSVELGRDNPVSGDWVGDASGHGPWWSASIVDGAAGSGHVSDLVPTRVTASTEGDSAALELTRRRVIRPGQQSDTDWGRCRTRTYLPHREIDMRAGLVVVGGSGGGMPPDRGWSLLASTGVIVTTIEFFGTPGLPAELDLIPIEVALDGADDLASRGLSTRPGILGVSRGSELALLAASTWPDRFGGVVAVVPSGVANVGLGASGSTGRSAWTVGGTPVPFYDRSPQEGVIAVDRIDGPLITLVAEDDCLWPSAMLLEPALERRRSSPHPRDRHLVFGGAGHTFFGYPGIPVGDPAGRAPIHPITGETMSMGGTRLGDAVARDRSWQELLAFA